MQQGAPPFSWPIIYFTNVLMALVPPILVLIGLKAGNVSLAAHFMIPGMLLVFAFGVKFAAPRLPWPQTVVSMACVFLVHFGVEHAALHWLHFPPLVYLGEYLVDALCVEGFGKYWVAKGYIPVSANI